MVASSDLNDGVLLEKIAKTKKPVVISTGGSSLKDLDDVVTFFANRNIPLAVNHCVSIYPSEDSELELNQIDFLRARYPNKAKAIRPSASTILRAPTRRFRRCARPSTPAVWRGRSSAQPHATKCTSCPRAPTNPLASDLFHWGFAACVLALPLI